MKKTTLLLAIATFAFFVLTSCSNQTSETASVQNLKADTSTTVEVSTNPEKVLPTRTAEELQLDSIYQSAVDSINSFVRLYQDKDGGANDVWWDSKKPTDHPFKRIRLCEAIDYSLIIERRPFPFNENLEVLGYTLNREYKQDGTHVYFVESSHFKKNAEITKERKRQYVTTREEMVIATEVFRKRLREAYQNLEILNGKQENRESVASIGQAG